MGDSKTAGSSNGYILVIIITISALCLSFLCQPVAFSRERLKLSDGSIGADEDEISDIGVSERAVFNTSKGMLHRKQSLKITTSSQLGEASEAVHPLSVIEIPHTYPSGPASAPIVWGRQREVELSDDLHS